MSWLLNKQIFWEFCLCKILLYVQFELNIYKFDKYLKLINLVSEIILDNENQEKYD